MPALQQRLMTVSPIHCAAARCSAQESNECSTVKLYITSGIMLRLSRRPLTAQIMCSTSHSCCFGAEAAFGALQGQMQPAAQYKALSAGDGEPRGHDAWHH